MRSGEAELEKYFELDVLRGWREVRDAELAAEHRLPKLAELVQVRDVQAGGGVSGGGWAGVEGERIGIYGPDVILGRFQPQQGPVDLAPGRLEDHENYRLGVPHLYFRFDVLRGWKMRLLTSQAATRLDGEEIDDLARTYPVRSGSVLELGVVRFVFESYAQGAEELEAWLEARRRLVEEVGGPALYLKRNGGICGPCFRLEAGKTAVIGRTAPGKGEIPGTARWSDRAALPDWDLAGLEEGLRKYIGFRHAKMRYAEGSWWVEPVSLRQWTYVNRVRIRGMTKLQSGDEIGLGSVLFHFRGEEGGRAGKKGGDLFARDRIVLPDVFSWHEGHVSQEKGGGGRA